MDWWGWALGIWLPLALMLALVVGKAIHLADMRPPCVPHACAMRAVCAPPEHGLRLVRPSVSTGPDQGF